MLTESGSTCIISVESLNFVNYSFLLYKVTKFIKTNQENHMMWSHISYLPMYLRACATSLVIRTLNSQHLPHRMNISIVCTTLFWTNLKTAGSEDRELDSNRGVSPNQTASSNHGDRLLSCFLLLWCWGWRWKTGRVVEIRHCLPYSLHGSFYCRDPLLLIDSVQLYDCSRYSMFRSFLTPPFYRKFPNLHQF